MSRLKLQRTRKRRNYHQVGRGAADTDNPNSHPFIQHVLGKGGFGIVIGMPRLPLLSEIELYESHSIGEKIRPLIGINVPFEEYKTRCEEISRTIPEGEGRDLFLKLCFEVQKFYKPSVKDHLLTQHLDLIILSSFKNLINEMNEVSKVYKGFDTPEKKKILDDAGILPIVDAEQVEAIRAVKQSNKFRSAMNDLFNGRVRPDDFMNLVENILPENVIVPFPNKIEHFINPIVGNENLWINNLFDKMMSFIGATGGRGGIDFESVGEAEEIIDIINEFEDRGIYPPPEITLSYLARLFTCITFPLAQKSLRALIDTIEGNYIRVSLTQKMNVFQDSRLEIMEYAKHMLALYGQGFVHNDLKSENIMMDHEGHIKFIDFGGVASINTPVQSIGLNIGSFKYPFWSFINILRRFIEIDLNGIPLTRVNIKRAITSNIRETDVTVIRNRLSFEIHRIDSITYLGKSIRSVRLKPIMNSIKILRNTILDAYLLDQQLKTGRNKDLTKINSALVTVLTTFAEILKDPLRISEEITLRNDVYSLGIVFVEYANALAKFILDLNGRASDQEERLLRFMYEYLRFATACMSIDIRVTSSVWLPKLQELAYEIGDFLRDEPSVTIDGIHSVSELLPGEFPLTTKESIMTDEQRSLREAVQRPKISDLLAKPLTDIADFREGAVVDAYARAVQIDPAMFNAGYADGGILRAPLDLSYAPLHPPPIPFAQPSPIRSLPAQPPHTMPPANPQLTPFELSTSPTVSHHNEQYQPPINIVDSSLTDIPLVSESPVIDLYDSDDPYAPRAVHSFDVSAPPSMEDASWGRKRITRRRRRNKRSGRNSRKNRK